MTTPNNPFDQNNNGNNGDDYNSYGSNSEQGNASRYGTGDSYGSGSYESYPTGDQSNAYGAAGAYPGAEGYTAGPVGERPNNYLVWTILTALFCCTPLGIVGIVFSAMVNSRWNAGNYDGAISASKNAKLFAIISAVLGFIGIVVYFGFLMFGQNPADV